MTTYLDASVLLRILLREPRPLPEWKTIRTNVSSVLTEIETMRTLDRLRFRGALRDTELAALRGTARRMLAGVELVHPDAQILRRAAEPFATSLASLDAVHLATAMAWQDERGIELTIATHDAELAVAGRAHGFRVVGA